MAIAKCLYVWGPNATKEGAEEIFRSLWPGCRYVWVHSVPKPDMRIRFRVIGLFGPGRSKRGPEPPSVDRETNPRKRRRPILDEPNEKVMVRLTDVDPEAVVTQAGSRTGWQASSAGGGQAPSGLGRDGRRRRGYERKTQSRRSREGAAPGTPLQAGPPGLA